MIEFGLGMLAGSLLAYIWVLYERTRLIETIELLAKVIDDEIAWQQILGASLYDPEDDDDAV